ncbi:hypothetical protein ACH3XW_0335 [Acanthocheilonema viteae]
MKITTVKKFYFPRQLSSSIWFELTSNRSSSFNSFELLTRASNRGSFALFKYRNEKDRQEKFSFHESSLKG